MHNAIWKSTIPIDDDNHTIQLPYNSIVVEVACRESGRISIWTIGNPDGVKTDFTFRAFGTGHLIPDDYIYCGTGFSFPFVWHVMMVP